MGGHIGTAFSEIALESMNDNYQELDWLVLELSSFQIEGGTLAAGISYYWIVNGLDESGEDLAGPSKKAIIVMP